VRVSWQNWVAGVISGSLVAVLLHLAAKANRSEGPDLANEAYFTRISHSEKELEDVRKNLRDLSRGVHPHETFAKVTADATRECAGLESLQDVPDGLYSTHEELIQWARTLKEGATGAMSSRGSAREVATKAVAKADALYRSVEARIAPEER
jgi:hypothetical protein